MYKTNYNDRQSRICQDTVSSTNTILHDEMKGPVDSAISYERNYEQGAKRSLHTLRGNFCHSPLGSISIDQIANKSSNITGYGIVDSMKSEWFVPSGNHSSWETMYQIQFSNPDGRITGGPNNIKSLGQYRLEQVYRHMRNRCSNKKI